MTFDPEEYAEARKKWDALPTQIDCDPRKCDATRQYPCATSGCWWPCGPCVSDTAVACMASMLEAGTAIPGRGPAKANRMRYRTPCPNVQTARAMGSLPPR